MSTSTSDSGLTELEARLAKRERRAWGWTVAASVVPVAAAVVFPWVTLDEIDRAQHELTNTSDKLVEAAEELDRVGQDLESARAERVEAEETTARIREELDEVAALKKQAIEEVERLSDRAAQLQNKIDSQREETAQWQSRFEAERAKVLELEERLAEVELRLEQAVEFEHFKYDINWAELKGLASQFEEAGDLLRRINEYRRLGVTWGHGDTPEKGFISPSFAGKILQDMRRLPDGLNPYQALLSLP